VGELPDEVGVLADGDDAGIAHELPQRLETVERSVGIEGAQDPVSEGWH
jgi:hypothetical protein